MVNNCHEELVWLVSNRLRPVNKPIRARTILGPYLSEAQPPKKAKTQPSTQVTESTPEVAVRLKPNSTASDLKKTLKDWFAPGMIIP